MRFFPAFLATLAGLSLGGCGTRSLPPYERPLAHTDLQQVRTTAYTDSERDHIEYGNRTALGGILRAAPVPSAPRAIPVAEPLSNETHGSYQSVAYVSPRQPFDNFSTQVYGSAAADWSRWPAGTIFRVVATGQLYRVEDYGWALAGRNTIDLYMSTPSDMNRWGMRYEAIQIVRWGDPTESLRRLAPHTKFRHIHRMVLELEGHDRAAAHLQ